MFAVQGLADDVPVPLTMYTARASSVHATKATIAKAVDKKKRFMDSPSAYNNRGRHPIQYTSVKAILLAISRILRMMRAISPRFLKPRTGKPLGPEGSPLD
jgi:hypothetical protein